MEEEKQKFALIGYPLGHSLSPVLYKEAFKEFNMDAEYKLIPTKDEELITRIKKLRAEKYFGFNVTIPHKVPVTLFLSKYDEYVNMTGSVNTVKIEEDLSLSGYNTDVIGFIEPLKDYDLEGKKAAIIGTGGASRAVCAGLYKLGIKKIDIYTRNVIDSKETIEVLRKRFDKTEIKAVQLSLMQSLEDVDILVNTTPVGMRNFDDCNSPVEERFIETLPDDAIVYDIVYNPYKTILIGLAIRHNKRYITGLDMLIHQAIAAFEIWTGNRPDFYKMKLAAVEEYLLSKV